MVLLLGVYFFLKFQRMLEVIKAQQRWLPALPGEVDLRHVLPLDILLDEGLEDLVGHAVILALREEVFLVKVETVGAIQVTDGSDGLGQRVEGGGRHGHTVHGHLLPLGGIGQEFGLAGRRRRVLGTHKF